MQNKSFSISRTLGRWAWLILLPPLAVCSGGGTGVTTEPPPTPVVTTIAVSPATASLQVGATQSLAATVKDQFGKVMSGQSVTWSTSNANSASVSSAGVVTGVAAGSATISAASAGKAGTSVVTVTAPPPVVTTVTVSPPSASIQTGTTTTLSATVKDQQGNVMTGQTIAWSTDNAAAATVNSSGVVSGVAAGSATIAAASSGVSGTATITVTSTPPPPPVVTTVTVSPTTAAVNVGATTGLTATVKDQNGNVMTGQTVTWSTNNAPVATVNSSGVVTGVSGGSATITATSSGKSGTASITVNAAPPPVVTTVTVSPTTAAVNVGATTGLTATVKDQNGNVMTGQTVTWSTNNAPVATVNSSGVVTGVSGGSATITATSSGKSGTSSITVNVPPPPGGGTLLFQEDFENANMGARGWYDNTNVLLNTTEHVAGSTASAQYRFTAGANDPTNGSAQRHKFTPTNSLYISYYVKYSANWVGSGQDYHPHEFYAMSTLDGDYDGPSENYLTVYLEQNYNNGGRPRMAMQDNRSINTSYGSLPRNLIGVTENRSTAGCNGVAETNIVSECFNDGYWYNSKLIEGPVTFQPTAGPGYKNNWNFVEGYFQLNTIVNGVAQADGIMQYWFNGTLVLDRHDIVFRTAFRPTLQFNQFLIAPYIGDGSPVDQSMFVDNLRVGTGRLP